MKIKNINKIDEFLEVILKCKGKIELLTPEGDVLNLKSTLCRYIGLSKMFNEARINDIEIVVHEPEDLELLWEYLIRG